MAAAGVLGALLAGGAGAVGETARGMVSERPRVRRVLAPGLKAAMTLTEAVAGVLAGDTTQVSAARTGAPWVLPGSAAGGAGGAVRSVMLGRPRRHRQLRPVREAALKWAAASVAANMHGEAREAAATAPGCPANAAGDAALPMVSTVALMPMLMPSLGAWRCLMPPRAS
jgi:hypothetical protein